MTSDEPKNLGGLVASVVRAWKSFWALPALIILVAIGVMFALTAVDGSGWSRWLWAQGVVLVETSDGYREAVSVMTGVNVAFTTLYFSITLLVLTLAASNLGVRLIDRWIARTFVRATLGLLLAATAASLLLLMLFDGEGDGASLPHASLLFLSLLMLVELVWLAVALNDLGRAIFVDTAIGKIGRDSCAVGNGALRAVLAPDWPRATPIRSVRDAYIVTTDIERLSRLAARWDSEFRIDRAAGDRVMDGEPILFSREPLSQEQTDEVRDCFTFAATRSDQEGLSYRIRLLVEIAARALSPAVNDFYTARACVDELATIMLHHRERLTPPGHILMEVERVYCPTASFDRLFDKPVAALRQGAAPYPAIVIRLIERLGVASRCADSADFTGRLREYAAAARQHGLDRAETDIDREDIERAFATAFGPGASSGQVAG
ncbi:DUF2254 family protein [Sphingomicrobium arenosum]|uniref:DUF2254 family protein n=1 Tax=Sphingomicrobium arenosum TaxID=2233861 RepID=UPI00223ECCAA|nr:DUF2254 family protein [Sphingomicrobium arenosum]